MTNEERLYRMLERFVILACGSPGPDAWDAVIEEAEQLLAATSAPTQMQQLVEWLNGDLEAWARTEGEHSAMVQAYEEIIDTIRTEFLGEEK